MFIAYQKMLSFSLCLLENYVYLSFCVVPFIYLLVQYIIKVFVTICIVMYVFRKCEYFYWTYCLISNLSFLLRKKNFYYWTQIFKSYDNFCTLLFEFFTICCLTLVVQLTLFILLIVYFNIYCASKEQLIQKISAFSSFLINIIIIKLLAK